MAKEEDPSYSVTFHSAAEVRPKPQEGVLEERWLHQLFLISHIPANWSIWQILASLFGISTVLWGISRLLGVVTNRISHIYTYFALSDLFLLLWLPWAKRSFGPIGPQFFLMTTPRIGVALVATVLSRVNATLGFVVLLIFQSLGSLSYLWGMLHEPFALTTTLFPFTASKIKSKARRLRLLHLSDLHVERLTPREFDLLTRINHIKPDIIVITGDYLNLSYVDESTARDEVHKFLKELDAPYGVYATLGSPPADPRNTTPSLFDETNIRLLRDEVAILEFDDGQKISLIGLDCEHDLDADMLVCKRLLDLAPDDSTRILLYHSPELMPQVQQEDVDLYLCGHTHGGQIRMPLYGALLTSSVTGKQYEMGRYIENDTTLYISRGIGLEGLSAPRMRLLCPPEIILFTLLGDE